MFKNKNEDGSLNICGEKIAKIRKSMKLSQRALADQLQLAGLDVSKNTIQQIESAEPRAFCALPGISISGFVNND